MATLLADRLQFTELNSTLILSKLFRDSDIFFAPLLTFTKTNRKFSCWRYWFVVFWLSITSFRSFLVRNILTQDKLLICLEKLEWRNETFILLNPYASLGRRLRNTEILTPEHNNIHAPHEPHEPPQRCIHLTQSQSVTNHLRRISECLMQLFQDLQVQQTLTSGSDRHSLVFLLPLCLVKTPSTHPMPCDPASSADL